MIVQLQKITWWLRTQFLRLRGMKIGRYTYVAKPLFIFGAKHIQIGNKVRIFPHVRMEAHRGGEIEICDDVSVGQNFHITSGQQKLIVGSHTTILGNVFVTNIDHEYRELDKHILEQPHIIHHTQIGENCFIGYGAAIQAGTVLGRQCIVGANSVVRGEFPDYCVIVGAPARIVRQYNPKTGQWEKIKK